MRIEESLNEFAKRGRPRKNARIPGNINATDSWGVDDDEEIINPDIVDNDASDMATHKIEIEDDVFDNKLLKALSNEVRMIEPSRANVRFRLKGNLSQILNGIPMTKMGKSAFLFKLQDGRMKKINLRDMILEQKQQTSRAKTVNENCK